MDIGRLERSVSQGGNSDTWEAVRCGRGVGGRWSIGGGRNTWLYDGERARNRNFSRLREIEGGRRRRWPWRLLITRTWCACRFFNWPSKESTTFWWRSTFRAKADVMCLGVTWIAQSEGSGSAGWHHSRCRPSWTACGVSVKVDEIKLNRRIGAYEILTWVPLKICDGRSVSFIIAS